MHSIDVAVQNYLAMARTPAMTEFWFVFTTLFNFSLHIVVIVLCVATLIYLFRGWKYAVLFVAAIALGSAFGFFLKVIFNVARPTDYIILERSKSFPSGHATTATIFFGMLMYTFDRYFSRAGRIIFNTLCVATILAVSFSRIYLGEHWLSDVLGGMFVGTFVCLISVQIFNKLYSHT